MHCARHHTEVLFHWSRSVHPWRRHRPAVFLCRLCPAGDHAHSAVKTPCCGVEPLETCAAGGRATVRYIAAAVLHFPEAVAASTKILERDPAGIPDRLRSRSENGHEEPARSQN